MTTKRRAVSLAFRAELRDGESPGFRHLEIWVGNKEMLEGSVGMADVPGVTYAWITSPDSMESFGVSWYGFDQTITHRTWKQMQAAYDIAKRVGRNFPDWGVSPEMVIKQLRRLGAEQYVYDVRLGCFIPATHTHPASFQRWMDGYRAMGRPGCTYSTVAKTEDTARYLIEKQATDHLPATQDWLDAWNAAGQPVQLDHYAPAPDTTPVEELVSSGSF